MTENTIQHAAWEDFLPTIQDESAELIVADPPYAIASKNTNFTRTKNPRYAKHNHDFGKWDYQEVDLNALTEQFWRILKPSGTVIVFYDLWKVTPLKEALEAAGKGFSKIRLVIWEKTNPVPVNTKVTYISNAREIAVQGVKGSNATFNFNGKFDRGIYSYPTIIGGKNRKEERFHTTQKPEALIRALIEKHSNPNDLVVDCFMGSGTTGAAALQTGRRFIGCEINEDYCKKANERIAKIKAPAIETTNLFDED